MIKNRILLLGVLFFLSALGYSQISDATNARFSDSLMGFDEAAAIRSALSENFLNEELPLRIQQLKRNYIRNRYNLQKDLIISHFEQSPQSVFSACINNDFESSVAGSITNSTQITGWIITSGNHTLINGSNSCNLSGCCPANPIEAELITAPSGGYIDSIIGNMYPIYSVFGSVPSSSLNPNALNMRGNNFLRLNSALYGSGIEKLSKSFFVTSNDSVFHFAYLPVIQGQHNCCDNPALIFNLLTSSSGNLSFSLSIPGSQCVNTLNCLYSPGSGSFTPYSSLSGNIGFQTWKINSVNIKPYQGQNITIEAVASDCNAGGHFGYMYVDAQCGGTAPNLSKALLFNGIPVDRNQVASYTTCIGISTISAVNFSNHYWTYGGTWVSGAPTLTLNSARMYVFTGIDVYSCPANISQSINVVFWDKIKVSSSDSVICKGESVILNASGLSGFNWSTGDTLNSISVSPLVSTSYTVSSTDSHTCTTSDSLLVSVEECTGLHNSGIIERIILIHPNPNQGEFTLSFEGEMENGEILIKNLQGQLVHNQKVYRGKNLIQTKELSVGVYYYSLTENKKNIATGKVRIE